MSPLKLEIYGPNKNWIKVAEVRQRDLPGSISDNKSDGSRDVYIFECLQDDSKSVIYRSKAGVDTEIDSLRAITTAGVDIVAEIRRGDKPYKMEIKTDKRSEPRQIRFTHI